MLTKSVLLLSFVSASFLVIQPSGIGQTAPSPQAAEIDHIALHVRELQKSADFYREVLGFKQIADPFKDGKHVFLRFGEHTQLHLIAGAQGDMSRDIDVHFALRVPTLESSCKLLEQKHIRYVNSKKEEGAVTTRPDGVKQIYFQDPDGYWIEINDSRF